MMRRIFISYRRADSADAAGRLYDRLAEQFGNDNVFINVNNIRPSKDYVVAIERRIANCDTMIVLIGPGWASATNEAGFRRLDDPRDLARLEVEAALQRNVRVIPILLGDAEMPETPELPEPLQALLRRQAVRLSHASFHKDVDLLLERLGRKVKRRTARRWLWLAASGAAAIAIVVAISLVVETPNASDSDGGEVRPVPANPAGESDAHPVRDSTSDPVRVHEPEPEPLPAPDPEPPLAPRQTATVYVAYAGDPYGCLLTLQLAIGGRWFALTSNPFPIRGLAEGTSDYQVAGTIQCSTIGNCAAGGSGTIEVEDEATYNLVWQNVAIGQCGVTLVETY